MTLNDEPCSVSKGQKNGSICRSKGKDPPSVLYESDISYYIKLWIYVLHVLFLNLCSMENALLFMSFYLPFRLWISIFFTLFVLSFTDFNLKIRISIWLYYSRVLILIFKLKAVNDCINNNIKNTKTWDLITDLWRLAFFKK